MAMSMLNVMALARRNEMLWTDAWERLMAADAAEDVAAAQADVDLYAHVGASLARAVERLAVAAF